MSDVCVNVPVSHLVDGMHDALDVVLGATARLGAHRSRHAAGCPEAVEVAVCGGEGAGLEHSADSGDFDCCLPGYDSGESRER